MTPKDYYMGNPEELPAERKIKLEKAREEKKCMTSVNTVYVKRRMVSNLEKRENSFYRLTNGIRLHILGEEDGENHPVLERVEGAIVSLSSEH